MSDAFLFDQRSIAVETSRGTHQKALLWAGRNSGLVIAILDTYSIDHIARCCVPKAPKDITAMRKGSSKMDC